MDQRDISELRCMEVFGGNRTVEQTFHLPGLDACLSSTAFSGGRGGDIHYLSTCGRGEIVRFLVADVAGHGASVSEVAAQFRRLVVKNLNRLDQSRMARKLNKELTASTEGGRFVTTLFASYHRPSGHLVVCNAGHQRPLLYRARIGQWEFLDYHIEDRVDELLNIPLGVVHQTDYYQFAVRLFPGDLVLLYTDGVSDRVGQSGASGEERLLEAVSALPLSGPEVFVREVSTRLGLDSAARERIDDETLLAFGPTECAFRPLSLGERLSMFGKMMGVMPVKASAPP